jgi:hypothetical protein
MFLNLCQCVDKLRILSVFISPILLLQDSIRRKHGRKSFVNIISIRWFFLTKLQLRSNLMNNMIVVCNRLEVPQMQMVPLMNCCTNEFHKTKFHRLQEVPSDFIH